MGKVRIWYHPTGKVSVSYPDLRPEKKPEGLTLDEWIDRQLNLIPVKAPQFAGLDFEDMDSSQLPQDRADRDRWRGSKVQGIKISPSVVLRKDLLKQVDDELAKPNPDVVKVLRIRGKLDRKEHD